MTQHTPLKKAPSLHGHDRLMKLRHFLKQDNLQGFLVPKGDEHSGEYIAPYAERLAWLTEFTGSAGLSIVLENQAVLFVDGRYTLQAAKQIDPQSFDNENLKGEKSVVAWLLDNADSGCKIGFDPWLHTEQAIKKLATACAAKKIEFVPCSPNPIDEIWTDQPAHPTAVLEIHDMAFAGYSAQDKLADIINTLHDKQAQACVLTLTPSIAWLLNIRSTNSGYLPAPLAFAIVKHDRTVELFLQSTDVSKEVIAHLGERVVLFSKARFPERFTALAQDHQQILVDGKSCPFFVTHLLATEGVEIVRGEDPCTLPKACKNPIEVQGARQAHVKDSAALVSFLAWLQQKVEHEKISEIEAQEKLLEFRQQQEHFVQPSFPTISSAGPNGAIIHYSATPETNRVIDKTDLYLVDSGGQYLDGTTDVTRVVTFAPPSAEQKDRFTRVLKGHIAIAQAKFPEGTTGQQLDILARYWLWQEGLDYEHGTGHGVGSYLGVHEGPQNIGRFVNGSTPAPLKPGMLLSNEPGYYQAGAYGIRIESIVVVTETEIGGSSMLGFETLTLVPICLDLIEINLLDQHEKKWLNDYHTQVREALLPLVDGPTQEWVRKETRAVL